MTAKDPIPVGAGITGKKQLEEQALRAQRLDSLRMLAAGLDHTFIHPG